MIRTFLSLSDSLYPFIAPIHLIKSTAFIRSVAPFNLKRLYTVFLLTHTQTLSAPQHLVPRAPWSLLAVHSILPLSIFLISLWKSKASGQGGVMRGRESPYWDSVWTSAQHTHTHTHTRYFQLSPHCGGQERESLQTKTSPNATWFPK